MTIHPLDLFGLVNPELTELAELPWLHAVLRVPFGFG